MHKRKQCQAHVSATGTQCKRKAMLGSRYCHLHHSWGKALLGSIVLLLVGAVLRPAAQQIWNNYLPSDDSRILRQLAFERPSFEFYVNGLKVPTNCLVSVPEFGELTTFSNATNFVVHIPESGEVRIAISNTGQRAADHLLIQFYAPALYTNTVVGNSWGPEPGFVGLQEGKLVTNPYWLHWVHAADFTVANGTMFSASPIYMKRSGNEKKLPVIISAASKETREARVAMLLEWE
ncbi:MAG TPA: hypothetical protein VFT34_13260 [Verrucomicrobiae bacterium]|nr:hypothetical protein [Verrucomicrobiae bacterium]